MNQLEEMRRAALEIFRSALEEVDAGLALRRAVSFDGSLLKVFDAVFDLRRKYERVYAVAAGKAAESMAVALDEILGERIRRGVVSRQGSCARLSKRWSRYNGGHPLPNAESFMAAREAFSLLDEANREDALIIFLISGGGSAMLELPREDSLTLKDFERINRVLVSCGATIAEINSVRRALSSVKGGGLAARAPLATQLTLIVSDVCEGRESDVASGPSLPPPDDSPDASSVVERYDLKSRMPKSALQVLAHPYEPERAGFKRASFVLLENRNAVLAAAEAAKERGFFVERADDIAEQDVRIGAASLVARLFDLYERAGENASRVCLVSGGEFSCPVRGEGLGGRNAETALRCAFEFEKFRAGKSLGRLAPRNVVALFAGTDGVDGNSPAAGALADSETLARSRAKGLDARASLEESDSYAFFQALGDAVRTGPTGTNVRDLRILLAG